jgi:hypothetical protein
MDQQIVTVPAGVLLQGIPQEHLQRFFLEAAH